MAEDFAAEHPDLFRLMFGAEVAHGRGKDPALREASEEAFGVLLEGVRRLAPAAPDATMRQRAVAAWSVVHGLSALLLDDQLEVAGLSVRDHDRIARAVLGSAPLGEPP